MSEIKKEKENPLKEIINFKELMKKFNHFLPKERNNIINNLINKSLEENR